MQAPSFFKQKNLDLVLNLFDRQGSTITRDIAYSLLQRCMRHNELATARRMHALMISSRLDIIPVFGDHLIRLFTSCGSLLDANEVFHRVRKPTVYTWNAIIQANAILGDSDRALQLYQVMQEDGFEPERRTFSSALKACTSIRSLEHGRLVHDRINRNRLELDLAVGNALVDCYGKCGSLEEAQNVFDNLAFRNVISWASLISGYVQHGLSLLSCELFQRMQIEGVEADKVIFLCVLQACGSIGHIDQGRLIHELLLESGLEKEMTITNALIDMYGKCGALEDAHNLFKSLNSRDMVTWGALISSYAQHGHGAHAFDVFKGMLQEGLKPDNMVFSSIVKTCESLGMLSHGRYVYNRIIFSGLESDVVLGTTLVDMFANCGSLDEAQRVFDKMPSHDVVSWGAMIAALLDHGDTFSAFEYFERMLFEDSIPDKATIINILKACGTIGAFQQVRALHSTIIRYRHELDVNAGNTIVDVYAKCGSLDEAYELFKRLPIRTKESWGSLITAYAKVGEWRLTLQWFQDLKNQGLKPDGVIYLGVLMACSHAGLLEEGHLHFKYMMEEHGITPNIEHFNCLVDILGRGGRLAEAEDVLRSIPLGSDIIGWTSLLTGCETYSNIEVGQRCYQRVKHLDPSYASGYVQLSNMFVNSDAWTITAQIV